MGVASPQPRRRPTNTKIMASISNLILTTDLETFKRGLKLEDGSISLTSQKWPQQQKLGGGQAL